MPKQSQSTPVPADPSQWSEKSKQSVAYEFVREYKDIAYKCWHCKAECVFTAQDQKYTFEVKKASIDQRRRLCSSCWSEAHRIREALQSCEEKWAQSKKDLKTDRGFLSGWLEQLNLLETYVPFKRDTARKNMLSKLLADA